MKTKAKSELVDRLTVRGAYDLSRTLAIVDRPDGSRVLLAEGYGGEQTLDGGCYCWRHGAAARLRSGDTFATLTWEGITDVLQGYDRTRPVLAWTGNCIQSVARSLHL